MPQAAVEQVFYRAGGCAASLRGAGAPCRDHPGGIPHRPLLSLELWGLSLPHAAFAVDRDAVLSDLLYLAQGPAGGSSHGRYADAAQAVRFGPVRRGPDGRRAAEPAVHGRGGGVLRPHVPLVRLGESSAPGSGDPSARPCVRTGERLAAGADPALAGVCVDGGTLPVYGLAAARRPGNLERTFFQQVPSSTWYFRPRLLYAGRSSYRSVHTVGRGHRPVDGSPRTIQKIISGRSLNDWR